MCSARGTDSPIVAGLPADTPRTRTVNGSMPAAFFAISSAHVVPATFTLHPLLTLSQVE
jgi:hypothetical protein